MKKEAMIIDVTKPPPTQAEIDAEAFALDRRAKWWTTLHWALWGCIASAVVCSGVLAWSQTGDLAVVFYAAGAGAVAGVAATATATATVPSTNTTTVATIAGAVAATVFAAVAAAIAGVTAGFAAVAGVVASGAVVVASQTDGCREQRALLKELPLARCPTVAELCKSDAECDVYRLAVVLQGRALIVGEAQAMEQWVAGSGVREKAAEAEHEQQVACAMVNTKEPLRPSV